MDLHSCKLTILTVLLLVTGMVVPVSAFAQPVDAQYDIYDELTVEMPDNGLYVPDEIIVKFSPGISEEKIANINTRNGAKVKYTSQYAGFKVLKIPENSNAQKMANVYSKNPNVEYAEPNYIASTCMVPNDGLYNYQWHLDNSISGGINMEEAWDISIGTGVTVAVLDTGVAYKDVKIRNRYIYKLAPDLAETNFVDGYDFVNNDPYPNDDEGHGTHVTGTIAQSTNNNLGVAGVAYGCSIMPVKVLDNEGSGYHSQIADGIIWATDNGAQVISMSLGGSSGSTTLEDAVAYAYDNGVTIVCAAGNEYENGNIPSYPAAYDEYCIAVGATRYDETRSYYSNTGSYVDIVAPGGDMTVDQNGDGYIDGVLQQTFADKPTDFSYYFYQGTSMATPHVSGIAALLISSGTATTPDEVRAAIESTAKDLGTPGWDSEYGYGLVNAYAALNYASIPDDVPPEIQSVDLSTSTPITGDSVSITVTATDDVGVVNVVADGIDLVPQASNIWQGNIIAEEGTHYVNVSAIDASSNIIWNNSTRYTATPDNIAPIINNVDLDTIAPYTGDPIQVSVYATDNVGVINVVADGVELVSQGSNIWEGFITAIDDTNYVNVSAIDAANNIVWDNSTSYTASPAPASEISIHSVEATKRTAGRNTFVSATAIVNIINDVPNSELTGYWTNATTKVDTAFSDGTGTLYFYSDEVKYKKGTLNFTFTIDGSSMSATYTE